MPTYTNNSANLFKDGTSINIVFTPDFEDIVVGLSKRKKRDGQVYKHPCGKIEACDVPSVFGLNEIELENATAERCATRELFRESGITLSHLALHHKLPYVREFTGAHGKVKQHHFLALLKEKLELDDVIIEAEEMNPPEYWPIITALRGGEDRGKFNPYHQLALCKCLQTMIAVGLGHDSNFPHFQTVLGNIYDANIELDVHTLNLQGMIECGEI